jgi:oligosaccharide repeat unit polymerase
MAELIFLKTSSIIFALGFVILTFIIKKHVGTIYHPAAILSLAWSFYTLSPLLLIYSAPINPFAILFILACVISFSLPVFIFNTRLNYSQFTKNKDKRVLFLNGLNSKFIQNILIMSSVLGVLFCFWTMIINGWSLNNIIGDLFVTSGRFAALRGNEGMQYGLIGMFGVFFTYLSASLGGIFYNQTKSNLSRSFIFIFAMLPGILAMVVQSSKLIFLIAFSFFISGISLINLFKIEINIFNKQRIITVIKLFVIIFPLALISFISREHYGDLDELEKIIDALKFAFASYALGQIYAFSDFFSFYVGHDSVSIYPTDYFRMGAYTFSSIVQYLGVNTDFPPGLYLETGFFSDIFETNIFTIFRGLILDFGLFGAIIVFGLLGLIANFVFQRIMAPNINIIASVLYIHILVFIFLSYLVSVLMARYMYSNAIALIILLLINFFTRSRPREKQ